MFFLISKLYTESYVQSVNVKARHLSLLGTCPCEQYQIFSSSKQSDLPGGSTGELQILNFTVLFTILLPFVHGPYTNIPCQIFCFSTLNIVFSHLRLNYVNLGSCGKPCGSFVSPVSLLFHSLQLFLNLFVLPESL